MHRRRQGRRTLGLFAVVATLVATILVLPSIPAAGAATPGGFQGHRPHARQHRHRGQVVLGAAGHVRPGAARSHRRGAGQRGRQARLRRDRELHRAVSPAWPRPARASPAHKLTGGSGAERAYEAYTERPRQERSATTARRGGAVGAAPARACSRSTAASPLRLPANKVGTVLAHPRRGRRAGGRARASPTPIASPDVHRRADHLEPARRPGARPARASSSATSTPASGRSTRRSPTTRRSAAPPATSGRHAPRLRLRRQPADPGGRRRSRATTSSSAAQPFLDTYNAVVGGEVYPDIGP